MADKDKDKKNKTKDKKNKTEKGMSLPFGMGEIFDIKKEFKKIPKEMAKGGLVKKPKKKSIDGIARKGKTKGKNR